VTEFKSWGIRARVGSRISAVASCRVPGSGEAAGDSRTPERGGAMVPWMPHFIRGSPEPTPLCAKPPFPPQSGVRPPPPAAAERRLMPPIAKAGPVCLGSTAAVIIVIFPQLTGLFAVALPTGPLAPPSPCLNASSRHCHLRREVAHGGPERDALRRVRQVLVAEYEDTRSWPYRVEAIAIAS